MLCSSQSKNTRGLTFCQLNLAQRCLHRREQAGTSSWSCQGGSVCMVQRQSFSCWWMAAFPGITCGIKRHEEKHLTKQAPGSVGIPPGMWELPSSSSRSWGKWCHHSHQLLALALSSRNCSWRLLLQQTRAASSWLQQCWDWCLW